MKLRPRKMVMNCTPVANAKPKKKAKNPLRIDPTRTATLRRVATARVRRAFAIIKGKLRKLLIDEDAFGLKERKPFAVNEWNPDQPRDEAGKFTSGGTSATQTDSDKIPAVERLILKLAERKGEPGPFMAKVQAVEHYVADKIKSNFEKLPETVQAVVSGGIKTAFAGWTASQALAERCAIERGLSVEQAATVRGALAAADIVAFKPVGFLAGMAGPVASALSWVVPPTTGAYLLTSAATSPIKTLKAAHGLVRDAVRGVKEKVHGSGGLTATLNNAAVLDALTKAGYSDWWFALFTAACAETNSVDGSIKLANELFNRHPVTNAGRFAFHSTPEQIKAFQLWLRQQIAAHILSEKDKDEWQAYAEAGWKKGAGRAWDDANQKKLRKRKPELFTPEKQDELKGFYAGSKDEFLRSAFSQPVSVERIQVLASRTFDDLKNVTDDMTARLSRTLTDGLARGDSPLDVAKDLAEDLDISRGRAETIARTEIIRAHAEGQLDSLKNMGVKQVGVEVELLATDDDRTCPECESLEGAIYDIDEARGVIPVHPSCRCSWTPANVGENGEFDGPDRSDDED